MWKSGDPKSLITFDIDLRRAFSGCLPASHQGVSCLLSYFFFWTRSKSVAYPAVDFLRFSGFLCEIEQKFCCATFFESVETHIFSIPASFAAAMLQQSKGYPPNRLTFLSGIPLDPLRAGMMARKLLVIFRQKFFKKFVLSLKNADSFVVSVSLNDKRTA